MDITLERILSLIPKKENGDFQHGSQKAFANSIGLKSGNLIADWIKGRSESYTNYLYEISAKYNVSLEWLRGETDDPAPKKSAPCLVRSRMQKFSCWSCSGNCRRTHRSGFPRFLKRH